MAIVFNHLDQRIERRQDFPGLDVLTRHDYNTAVRILGTARPADLPIAPDGEPYLYRWYVYPKGSLNSGNLYFHIQVRSDPERPLHDHPWDNTSFILAGCYDEQLDRTPVKSKDHPGGPSTVETYRRLAGDMITRNGDWAHRLILPEGVSYTMTLFMTGPEYREWGFWYPDGWVSSKEVTQRRADGASIHTERKR